jgi:hypothetical protein
MAGSPPSAASFLVPATQSPRTQPLLSNPISLPPYNGNLSAYNHSSRNPGLSSAPPSQMPDIYGNLPGYPSSNSLLSVNTDTVPPSVSMPKPKKEDRPWMVSGGKALLEMLTGTGGYYLGSCLGAKKSLNFQEFIRLSSTYNKPVVLGGLAGFAVAGALTGALFSMVYQKYKTNAVDQATLIKDTLWGVLGF